MPVFAGKKTREIKQCNATTPRMGAMVYALPKSHVQIEIEATCTISKPGPFAQYAERYLADDKAITQESKIWRFENARATETFIPDSQRMYLISFESQPVEFIEGTMMISTVGTWDKKLRKVKFPGSKADEVTDTVFHTELLGEEALTSTSIPKMAERAAKQIFQLREARTAIMTCDVNHQPDGVATKEILERIDREERELTALFLGKKIVTHTKRCFDIDPAAKKQNIIIARMSTLEGIVTADDMIGTPIYVNVTPAILTAPAETKKEQKAHKGYYYNVPGSAVFVIKHGDCFTVTNVLDIPQNGYATWLDPSVSNIQYNSNGTIHRMK